MIWEKTAMMRKHAKENPSTIKVSDFLVLRIRNKISENRTRKKRKLLRKKKKSFMKKLERSRKLKLRSKNKKCSRLSKIRM